MRPRRKDPDLDRIVFAPWHNHCVIAGACMEAPELHVYERRDGKGQTHLLRFPLVSWARKRKQMRLILNVALFKGAEFWHSVLGRGSPVIVTGQLESWSFDTKNDGRKKAYRLSAWHLARLYAPRREDRFVTEPDDEDGDFDVDDLELS